MTIFRKINKEQCVSLALAFSVLTALVLPFSTALTNIFFIAVAVFWLFGSDIKNDFKWLLRKTFACALVCFLIFVCLSVFWKEGSFSSYWSELRNYRRFLFLLIVFLLLKDRKEWCERVLFAFFISTTLLTLVCIGIHFEIPFFPPIREGQGAILSKSHIAQGFLLGCHIVIAIRYMIFSEHIELRMLSAITATLAFVVTVFMTYGRTGYLCVVFAFALAAAFFFWQKRNKWAILFSGLLVLGILMVAVSGHVQSRWENAMTDVTQFEHGKMNTSMGLRFYYWRTSINIIKDNPVVGVGCGSLKDVVCNYAQGTPNEDGTCFAFTNPHQDYLYVLVQFGLVGFLLWMAFFYGIWKEFLRSTLKDKWTIWGVTGLYLAGGFFNSFSRDITEGTTFVILIAVLLALSNVSQSSASKDAEATAL